MPAEALGKWNDSGRSISTEIETYHKKQILLVAIWFHLYTVNNPIRYCGMNPHEVNLVTRLTIFARPVIDRKKNRDHSV